MATSVPAVPPKKLFGKHRAICFTLNNYTDEQVHTIKAYGYKYLVFGYELAPTTQTPHLQGYICWPNPRSVDAFIEAVSKTLHITVAKGSAEDNRVYCTKDGKFEEYGEIPVQGDRTDWRVAVAQIQSGISIEEVVVNQPQLLPGIRALERFQTISLKPTHRQVKVVVIYGESGTGKSKWAWEKFPNLYSKPRGDWWDGYVGQKVLLLDDYYGYLPYSLLLNVLDRYPLQIPVKGGYVQAQWDTIIITSNSPPSQWYKGGMTPALARRLNKIFYLSIEHKQDDYQALQDYEVNKVEEVSLNSAEQIPHTGSE